MYLLLSWWSCTSSSVPPVGETIQNHLSQPDDGARRPSHKWHTLTSAHAPYSQETSSQLCDRHGCWRCAVCSDHTHWNRTSEHSGPDARRYGSIQEDVMVCSCGIEWLSIDGNRSQRTGQNNWYTHTRTHMHTHAHTHARTHTQVSTFAFSLLFVQSTMNDVIAQ